MIANLRANKTDNQKALVPGRSDDSNSSLSSNSKSNITNTPTQSRSGNVPTQGWYPNNQHTYQNMSDGPQIHNTNTGSGTMNNNNSSGTQHIYGGAGYNINHGNDQNIYGQPKK
ncbi:hypothetical protein PM082_023744 [Marasmius tenuissimus]|nr:hypothetical protein PM082_023744 [Marasmius tenuissimus]